MPADFISLNCQHCGGKLDVYPDMDRFACGYCGSEMMVQRRGGTVALKAVTEAIKKVEFSTNRAAAEVALMRYAAEERELAGNIETRRKERDNLVSKGIGCSIFPLLFGFLLLSANAGRFGGYVLFVGIAVGIGIWAGLRTKNKELSDLESRSQDLLAKISEKKRIAEG